MNRKFLGGLRFARAFSRWGDRGLFFLVLCVPVSIVAMWAFHDDLRALGEIKPVVYELYKTQKNLTDLLNSAVSEIPSYWEQAELRMNTKLDKTVALLGGLGELIEQDRAFRKIVSDKLESFHSDLEALEHDNRRITRRIDRLERD